MSQFKLDLPLAVTIPRKTKADKTFILNMNVYRNAHYMTLNQAKVKFKEIVACNISLMDLKCGDFPSPPFSFNYTVYPKNGRAFDVANVLSVIDKFTCDALVELGIISDDNYKNIGRLTYQIGPQDKNCPRAELVIEHLENASWDK